MAETLTHNQIHNSPQDALAHYGVKGMKWGVRKKEETSPREPSARQVKKQEKRADKVANLSARKAKNEVHISELKSKLEATPNKGIANRLARNDLKNQLKYAEDYDKSITKTLNATKEGRLTPNQKRLLIGGVVVGGLFAAGYMQTKVESGEFNALKLKGQARLRNKPHIFDQNEKWSGKLSHKDVIENVVPGINPGYKTDGGKMNCRRCSMTYELRRRGFNVDATTSSLGYGQSESGLINALTPGKRNLNRSNSLSATVVRGQGIRGKAAGDSRFNKAETYSHKDAKDQAGLLNLLRQQPDGARGEAVFNFTAFAHSLSYERFGDKIYIFDTQKGKSYDLDSPTQYNSFLSHWGIDRVSDVQITRLDNADLDYNFLARWATNRESRRGRAPING